MAAVQQWCRVTLVDADGVEIACCVLEGPGAPDLGAVDDFARLALLARRLGGGIVVTDLSPPLGALLELAGLGVEVERQAELGEEAIGVQRGQEERHPGDLPT